MLLRILTWRCNAIHYFIVHCSVLHGSPFIFLTPLHPAFFQLLLFDADNICNVIYSPAQSSVYILVLNNLQVCGTYVQKHAG